MIPADPELQGRTAPSPFTASPGDFRERPVDGFKASGEKICPATARMIMTLHWWPEISFALRTGENLWRYILHMILFLGYRKR
jgi:hypothetical protein